MSDGLPDLPPGYGWRVDQYDSGAMYTVTQGGSDLWWGYSLDDAAYMAERARDLHDHLLRATLDAIAAEAGVVLPPDVDPLAVMRVGLAAVGPDGVPMPPLPEETP